MPFVLQTEAQIDQILSFPLKAKTYNTITRREALLNELKLSRERGYSMDNEEIEIGLTCVGFPVFKGFEDPALPLVYPEQPAEFWTNYIVQI